MDKPFSRTTRVIELAALAVILFNLAMVAYSFRGDWIWSAEDDVRQSLFPFARAQDPGLFPNDLIAVHALAFAPAGYTLGLNVGARFLDVIIASKLIAIGLAIANVALFLWIAGLLFRHRSRMFWICLVFASANAYMWFVSLAGMPRSFAIPLSLLAFVAFQRPGRALYIATAVLAGLFSPSVLIFLGVLAPFKLFEDGVVSIRPRLQVAWRQALLFALALGLCATFVAVGQRSVAAELGPTADWSEWQSNPAFQPGGRWPGERLRPLQADLWVLRDRAIPFPDDRMRIIILAILLAAGGASVVRSLRGSGTTEAEPEWRALRAFLAFFAAGIIGRGVATAVALKLYMPDRLLVPVAPATLFALFALAGLLLRRLALHPRFQASPLRWAPAVGVGALLLVAVPAGGVRRPDARRAMNIHLGSADRELLTFLRDETPRTALIAGNPVVLDNVPLFARRSVLVNWETSLPLYPRYYAEVIRKTNALIPAYFTQERSDVDRLRREMKVTHMVVRLSDFEAGVRPWTGEFVHGPAYIQPFTPLLQGRISAKRSTAPWLWETLEHDPAVLFRNSEYLVVDLERLGAGADSGSLRAPRGSR